MTGVATDGNGNVVVSGSNFKPDSQVYFDGLPADTNVTDSSHATAIPPPGASSQTAAVIVFNSDGQDSMFYGPDAADLTAILQRCRRKVTFSPSSTLPAGAEAEIDIEGANTDFIRRHTAVGYGSSDVLVRGVWVLSPTHALANVQIAPNARKAASGHGGLGIPGGHATGGTPNRHRRIQRCPWWTQRLLTRYGRRAAYFRARP